MAAYRTSFFQNISIRINSQNNVAEFFTVQSNALRDDGRSCHNIALCAAMAWQKTFTLSRKGKGCHLVTEEIVSQLQPGLLGVEASLDKGGKMCC